ncbi:Uncharacterized protein TPAR_01532 [Tolypocladium paradoxum]|uniref:Carbohydrate-binding module family 19 domain-containing protein n=1 Tax=Tolypocladium paradoxum TaxID=94208 RepID=A0A2S4L750_9HYPO|nr:Uncharacterized protein TPAR_01532 [Tolypocladium paradoxum]
MKFLALTIASLASIAAASPQAPDSFKCKPGTYQCAKNPQTGQPGWNVCNTSGQWVFGGNCPPHTVCFFDTVNGSPYCVPPGYQIP